MPATTAAVSGLARRYATALFELAREQKQVDAIAADMEAIEALRGESADFRRLLASPVITRAQQVQGVETIAEKARLSDLTKRFLGVVAEHRRLFALSDIVRGYQALLAEAKGEVVADVTSASPLSEDELASVRETIQSYAGKAVSLTTAVDPGLLGGLVVRVGSRMVDASLKRKLQNLEMTMRGLA